MKKNYFLFLLGFTILLSSCAKEPDAEKIKGDLIGHSCKISVMSSWSFDSLSEFESFNILNRTKKNDILEYRIDMSLNDGGRIYNVIANVVYRKEGRDWKLVSVISDI